MDGCILHRAKITGQCIKKGDVSRTQCIFERKRDVARMQSQHD